MSGECFFLIDYSLLILYFSLTSKVIGKKYVRLYDDKYRDQLYPHKEKILHNTSQVDLENLDLEKYTLIKSVPYWEGILSEGQMLYIPPKCWHYIKSQSLSFSVSFWWK